MNAQSPRSGSGFLAVTALESDCTDAATRLVIWLSALFGRSAVIGRKSARGAIEPFRGTN